MPSANEREVVVVETVVEIGSFWSYVSPEANSLLVEQLLRRHGEAIPWWWPVNDELVVVVSSADDGRRMIIRSCWDDPRAGLGGQHCAQVDLEMRGRHLLADLREIELRGRWGLPELPQREDLPYRGQPPG